MNHKLMGKIVHIQLYNGDDEFLGIITGKVSNFLLNAIVGIQKRSYVKKDLVHVTEIKGYQSHHLENGEEGWFAIQDIFLSSKEESL